MVFLQFNLLGGSKGKREFNNHEQNKTACNGWVVSFTYAANASSKKTKFFAPPKKLKLVPPQTNYSPAQIISMLGVPGRASPLRTIGRTLVQWLRL